MSCVFISCKFRTISSVIDFTCLIIFSGIFDTSGTYLLKFRSPVVKKFIKHLMN